MQLDDRLAEAHISPGYSDLVFEWNFPEAQKEFERALELRPDYATAHEFYAYYLTVSGRLSEAIAERKKAVELEPLNPLLTSALGRRITRRSSLISRLSKTTSRSISILATP